MVTSEQTRVIDPEFAVYGPMDSTSAPSCRRKVTPRRAITGRIIGAGFLIRWKRSGVASKASFLSFGGWGAAGDAFVPGLFEDEGGRRVLEAYRVAFMARLLQDSIGFAAPRLRGAFLVLPMSRTWNRSGIPTAERAG